jgi:hypothetical protein
MSPTRPIRVMRARFGVCATLALALAACTGAQPSASHPPTSQTPDKKVAALRCASTPNASPIATVQWNQTVHGSPTIKAGEAVAFITQSDRGPTVTEGIRGKPAVDLCIDKVLVQRSPLVVTFYQPGDYNVFCRLAPEVMYTVVHVQ